MSPDRFADRAQPEVEWIKPREKNKSTLLRAFVFLAGGGFEPPDLRVMSPTSYQTALSRGIMEKGRMPETGLEPVRNSRYTGF